MRENSCDVTCSVVQSLSSALNRCAHVQRVGGNGGRAGCGGLVDGVARCSVFRAVASRLCSGHVLHLHRAQRPHEMQT